MEGQSDNVRSHKEGKQGFLKKWEVLPCALRQEEDEEGQKGMC